MVPSGPRYLKLQLYEYIHWLMLILGVTEGANCVPTIGGWSRNCVYLHAECHLILDAPALMSVRTGG
jgi:hypothetical protein